MLWYVAVGTLAAFGLLCALWVSLGWLLPGLDGCAIVFAGVPDVGICSRYRWLKGLGFLRCPFLAVGEENILDRQTEYCTGEALLSRLEQERERFYGTGAGDSARSGQRRNLPEL